MTIECKIVERPTLYALAIHAHSPQSELSQLFDRAYGSIMQHIAQLGQPMAGAPYAAYYNMDMSNLELDAGIPTATLLNGAGEIQAKTIPATRAVTAVHVGPYQTLSDTYKVIWEYIAQHGLQPTGVAYEFYVDDPTEVAPEALKTEIVFPLR